MEAYTFKVISSWTSKSVAQLAMVWLRPRYAYPSQRSTSYPVARLYSRKLTLPSRT